MAKKKLAVRSCDAYYGVSVEQVKNYLARKGAGHVHRKRFLRDAKFQQSGKSVLAETGRPHSSDWDQTLYRCEYGRIVGYADYRGSLR
jgi:hypothetical protein